MTVAVLPERGRPMLEPLLPAWIEPRWWGSPEELVALAPDAEIGWFDLLDKDAPLRAMAAAGELRWLNTAFAGVDWLPLADFHARGVKLTCGRGLTAMAVAEWVVLSMLAAAKDYRAVAMAQERREWLDEAPAVRELAGSRALVMGQGPIGQALGPMLEGLGVEVVPVRRTPGAGELGPDDWRARLGEFDWIVLALPGTAETRGLFGAAEFAAMKREAVLVNFARADIVETGALIDALRERRIAAAVLDVTNPEPLPPGHPLWDVPNAHITMHLSGIPSLASLRRGAERFARNCEHYRKGEPMEAEVDLLRGY